MRRGLLACVVAAAAACHGGGTRPTARPADVQEPATLSCGPTLRASLHAWYDLPADDPRSHNLSGIAWDAATGALYAVPDRTPQIVALIPDQGLSRWSFGATIAVTGVASWDAEALALDAGRF